MIKRQNGQRHFVLSAGDALRFAAAAFFAGAAFGLALNLTLS